MTIYWIDFNRGNDANSGTSLSQPWRNLYMLESVVWTAGDIVLLADDSEWYLHRRVLIRRCNGNSTAPIVFDRYSATGAASSSWPTLRMRYAPRPVDWTFDSSVGAWYLAEPNGARLIDVQGSGVMLLGPSNQHGVFVRRFSSPNTPLAGNTQWSVQPATNRYYLYAPRSIDPTTYYGGVLIGPSAEAQAALLFVRCGSNVRIRNLRFEECGTGVTVALYSYTDPAAAPQDIVGFRMESCQAFNVGSMAYIAADYIPGSFEFVHQSPIFTGNTIERCATAGIRLWNTANPVIESNTGNKATGCSWPIGFVYIDSSNNHPRTGGGSISGNRFSRASHATEFYASDNIFDGAAIYCEAGSRNVEIRGNIIMYCHTAFQDNGGRSSGNTWIANILNGCGRAAVFTDADKIGTGTPRFLHNLCMLNGGDSVMPSVSGVTGALRYAINFTGVGSDRVVVANNIFFSRSSAAFGVLVDPALSSTVRNNLFSGIRLPYGTTEGTRLLNGSNIETDPALVDIWKPELGITATSRANRGGVTFDGTRDFIGRSYGPTPHIGPWAVLPR
jgi:hypothetical protein